MTLFPHLSTAAAGRPIIRLLWAIAAFTAVAVLAQIVFPLWAHAEYSPFMVAYQIGAVATLAVMVRHVVLRQGDPRLNQYWLMAGLAFASLPILQFADYLVENHYPHLLPVFRPLEAGLCLLLAGAEAATLFWRPRLSRRVLWIEVCQIILILLLLFLGLSELLEGGSNAFWQRHHVVEGENLIQLGLVEFYIIALALSAFDRPELVPVIRRGGQRAGENARACYHALQLQDAAKHPPIRPLLYPLFQEAFLLAAMGWLLAITGGKIRSLTGKSRWQQAHEMMRLWFEDGIDPPSYYQLELYRHGRDRLAPHYLTRFETKNGLFKALNTRLPSPYGRSEMNDKSLFAEACDKAGIPHARTLIAVHKTGAVMRCLPEALQGDLFCKPSHGMGAHGTSGFHYLGDDHYADDSGVTYSLAGILAKLQAGLGPAHGASAMLVQRWLRNHAEIADLAEDSLIAIRVITLLNEHDQPEIVFAMLRVLAKLEPKWDCPDGEYAAEIDLASGRLGLFTGDSMRTSDLRYSRHLVTQAPIEGRVLSQWPAVRDVALAAHQAFPHRALIGWDIALTPEGPVVLEGNTNPDVMFLQRVLDKPVGATRFGDLVNHQLALLIAARAPAGARLSPSGRGFPAWPASRPSGPEAI